MISKKKIYEINARRKPMSGFTQADFDQAMEMARPVIAKNKIIASTNVADIYERHLFVTTSFNGIHYSQSSTRAKRPSGDMTFQTEL